MEELEVVVASMVAADIVQESVTERNYTLKFSNALQKE